jgi:3-oxoacyl-[acyl-carrier-protein] synthase-3
MLYPVVRAVDYFLPAQTLTNDDLARDYPEWQAEKTQKKIGIVSRRIAARDEYASDLAVEAARRLLDRGFCRAQDVEFILMCTQSPDYLLPSTACLVQHRLGLSKSVGALDINLGCSGYVYGLSLAAGLIATGQARNVLLLTADTYSKHMEPSDLNVRAIFGDGAACTLLEARSQGPEGGGDWIGPFVFGTDGGGAEDLILRRGGTRGVAGMAVASADAGSSTTAPPALTMNGPAVFSFALREVPLAVTRLLACAGIGLDAVDMFVFHQANGFMLEHLRTKIGIPQHKFAYALEDCGNTTSSSIPIALARLAAEGRIRQGERLMLVGFGVGYSWAASLMRWIES